MRKKCFVLINEKKNCGKGEKIKYRCFEKRYYIFEGGIPSLKNIFKLWFLVIKALVENVNFWRFIFVRFIKFIFSWKLCFYLNYVY